MIKQLKYIVLFSLLVMQPTLAERIKDIAQVAGLRTNQLVGYGLVVGLDGTGDSVTASPFTLQSFKSMLSRLGVVVPSTASPSMKNAAAVIVTAELHVFAKPGQNIDVTVSSLGNAKSLRGGTLIMTPLKGADGNIYAVAQGNLVVGGFGGEGADGSKITVNIPSVGRIPNGASVERSVITPFSLGQEIIFNLHSPDFTTAKRLVDVINYTMGRNTAEAIDATSIRVNAPKSSASRVNFLAQIENLQVNPGEVAARVVVNSRTGTIVIGDHVMVQPAAVTHGSLTVTISENNSVSQPGAFATVGTTESVQRSTVQVSQITNRMFLLNRGSSLKEIVRAINVVGAAPGDLMAILEALKQVGALKAEIVVI